MRTLKQIIAFTMILVFIIKLFEPIKLAQAASIQQEGFTAITALQQYECNDLNVSLGTSPCSNLITQATDVSIIKKKLHFSDTDEFYKELTNALQSGYLVNVITPFHDYSDFPPRLKKFFQPDWKKIKQINAPSNTNCPSNVNDCIPIASENIPGLLNYSNPIFTYLSMGVFAIIGVGVGWMVGGAVDGFLGYTLGKAAGAFVGFALGAVMGSFGNSIYTAIQGGKHEVNFHMAFTGLDIQVRPVVVDERVTS